MHYINYQDLRLRIQITYGKLTLIDENNTTYFILSNNKIRESANLPANHFYLNDSFENHNIIKVLENKNLIEKCKDFLPFIDLSDQFSLKRYYIYRLTNLIID